MAASLLRRNTQIWIEGENIRVSSAGSVECPTLLLLLPRIVPGNVFRQSGMSAFRCQSRGRSSPGLKTLETDLSPPRIASSRFQVASGCMTLKGDRLL